MLRLTEVVVVRLCAVLKNLYPVEGTTTMITPALLIIAGIVCVALSMATTFLIVERSWPKWALVLALIITIISTIAVVLLGAVYADAAFLNGCKT